MNLKEVIFALADGKKVRNKEWEQYDYVMLDLYGLIDVFDNRHGMGLLDDGEWEIFDETKLKNKADDLKRSIQELQYEIEEMQNELEELGF